MHRRGGQQPADPAPGAQLAIVEVFERVVTDGAGVDLAAIATGDTRANTGLFEQRSEGLSRGDLMAIKCPSARQPADPVGSADLDAELTGGDELNDSAGSTGGQAALAEGVRRAVSRHRTIPQTSQSPG